MTAVTARNEPSRTRTEEVLLAMLTENTGKHFLDSGGIDGRHWQRNADRDIETEAPSVLDFRYDSIALTHRVFHWLRDRVEFDEDAKSAFDGAFRAQIDPTSEKSAAELREEFPEWYARYLSRTECGEDGDDYEATGLYGGGVPVTVNTYNEPNLLDQTLLFTYFELRTAPGRSGIEGALVVLQIHGGCDVRGGYTRPEIFQITRDEPTDIFDYRSGTISCAGDREGREAHFWVTDDGSHWYADGACGRGAGTQLERYERKALDEQDAAWEPRRLCVRDDGIGLCPLCGAPLAGGA